jgi:hypothetical protein
MVRQKQEDHTNVGIDPAGGCTARGTRVIVGTGKRNGRRISTQCCDQPEQFRDELKAEREGRPGPRAID